jgi:hypothetical protein
VFVHTAICVNVVSNFGFTFTVNYLASVV